MSSHKVHPVRGGSTRRRFRLISSFLLPKMNVGDAVRGMAGQIRTRSGSQTIAYPGSPQHAYEGMQYSPSPTAFGSPVPVQVCLLPLYLSPLALGLMVLPPIAHLPSPPLL